MCLSIGGDVGLVGGGGGLLLACGVMFSSGELFSDSRGRSLSHEPEDSVLFSFNRGIARGSYK